MNNSSKKNLLLGIILLLSSFNLFAQDTLEYRFMNPLKTTFPKDSILFSDMVVYYYYIDDSVFVIEGLFDRFHANYSTYRYHFKIEKKQWFMKYEAGWKIFFNGREEKCGSWLMYRNMDIALQWKKTSIKDNIDTIFKFTETPFYDKDNPLLLSTNVSHLLNP